MSMLLLLQSSAAPAGSTVTTSQAQTGSMSGAVSVTATGATQQAQTAGATGNQTVVAVISGQQGQSAAGSGSAGIAGTIATAQSQSVTGNAALISASSGSTAQAQTVGSVGAVAINAIAASTQAQGSSSVATISNAEVVEVAGFTGYPGKQKKQKQYYEQPVLTLLSDRVEAKRVAAPTALAPAVEVAERLAQTVGKSEIIATLARDLSKIQTDTQAVQRESIALEDEIIRHQEQQTLAAFEALMRRMDERDIELLLFA